MLTTSKQAKTQEACMPNCQKMYILLSLLTDAYIQRLNWPFSIMVSNEKKYPSSSSNCYVQNVSLTSMHSLYLKEPSLSACIKVQPNSLKFQFPFHLRCRNYQHSLKFLENWKIWSSRTFSRSKGKKLLLYTTTISLNTIKKIYSDSTKASKELHILFLVFCLLKLQDMLRKDC